MNISLHYNIETNTGRRIAISKIYGIWKKETALKYVEEYKEAVKPLLGGRWARLINLSNWKLSYPEIVEIINEHILWCYENGAEYLAFVIDNPVTIKQLRRMVDVGKAIEATQMFKTYAKADTFLRDHGF